MENNWSIKREERYQRWLSAPGVVFSSREAEKSYRERVSRVVAAYRVTEPDRVPLIMPTGSTPAYLAGSDLFSVMYDYSKLIDAWSKLHQILDMDTVVSPGSVLPGRVYDMLNYKLYSYPGHGIPKEATGFQFVEGEYMLADEYDALIRNPSDFWMRTYLPRVIGVFEPFKLLPSFTSLTELPAAYFLPYANPELQKSLQSLMAIGQEVSVWQSYLSQFTKWVQSQGFPTSRGGGLGKAPFDIIGDTLRGTRGIFMDMYRQPEKLLEAIDVVTKIHIDQLVSSVNASNALIVQFALHKGSDGFMSQKQFDKFYWPSLRKVILALLDEGILPVLFAEGSYMSRLDTVNEFPKGAVAWYFDKTDMKTAKQKLGQNCCIQGNVPTSLLLTGTPSEVREHCRRLIEDCKEGGGYILECGASVDRGNFENLKAMSDAVKEFGTYRH
jgi:hypothetical protein